MRTLDLRQARRQVPAAAAVLLAVVMTATAMGSTAGAGTPVPGATDCPMFPADNVWNADVSGLPVHERSAAWLTSMGAGTKRLHPDFGPSFGEQPVPYGIPYAVVDAATPRTAVTFDFDEESDPGPYPFTASTPIEGGPQADGDRHALMVDKDACRLYELYSARYAPGGSTAGSGAVWDLRSNQLRPDTWTSADAAGLPILPGLLRRDEVAAGAVTHAVRFTAQRTDRSYLWPARHQAGAASDPNLPPMGARFRLKAGTDLSGFRPDTQVVLRGFQKYGLLLADNGSDWFFSGSAEDGWDTDLLDELKSIPASAFEAVDESSLMVDPNSGQAGGAVAGPPVTRVAGAGRVATAVAVSQAAFAPTAATAAVLTRSDDFADALAGTPLAVSAGGPLLVTPSSALDDRVGAELSRALAPGATVWLLGGEGAMSAAVADAVGRRGFTVKRLAGANRFATAVAVADTLPAVSTALIATGLAAPDALAAGAAAPGATGAVLLTAGTTLPAETAAYLDAHNGLTRVAVGGAAAAAVPSAEKLVGADRFDTARRVAQRFFTAPTFVGVASGTGFADALSGGADAARRGGPMLLVLPGSMPAATQTYLGSVKASVAAGSVYGGPAAVSETVLAAVRSALR